jgi:hypothetical protein
LNLRNELPTADSATVEYKYSFATHDGQGSTHTANFDDFVPTIKGEAATDAHPLDISKVREISIMCSSLFGRQEGDFEIVIGSISAVKSVEESAAHERFDDEL